MSQTTPVLDRHKEIKATAVWLRRIGDHAQVLVEIDGKFRLAIQESIEGGTFSHIAEGNGASRWPIDNLICWDRVKTAESFE